MSTDVASVSAPCGPPQLILTGGTLSMSRNAAGDKVPSGEALDGLAKDAGFSAPVKPYIIDSINLNIDDEYMKLRDATLGALEAGKTPIICGGTDSLIWYSTLLTKDMMRRGYLQHGSNQKIIFLSSMKSIEDAPELVKHILETGKKLAGKPWSGGFAISAESVSSKQFVVHNVLNDFEKISASLTNALRSKAPVGYLSNDTYTPTEMFEEPAVTPPSDLRTYARIAPPLIRGHDSEAMLAYMRMAADAKPPFDGVILESPVLHKPFMHENDRPKLVSMVAYLKKRGIRVAFCNTLNYHSKTDGMKPMLDDTRWHHPPEGSIESALQQAGAEFVTGMAKDVYMDMMLSTKPQVHTFVPLDDQPSLDPMRNQKVLGLRYVPCVSVMETAIKTFAPHAKNILFYALPGDALTDKLAPTIKENAGKTRFWKRFEYDGRAYIDPDNGDFVEGANIDQEGANPYEAGKQTRELVALCPFTENPVRQIYMGRPHQMVHTSTPDGTRQWVYVHPPKDSDRPSSGNSARNR